MSCRAIRGGAHAVAHACVEDEADGGGGGGGSLPTKRICSIVLNNPNNKSKEQLVQDLIDSGVPTKQLSKVAK